MKKILAMFGALLLLSGCAMNQANKETTAAIKMAEQSKTILFTAVNNPAYKVSVISNDMFESAVFIDANGKKHDLKSDVSANGIHLVNSDGIDLIFNKGIGYLTISKDAQEIELKYAE